MIANLIRSPGMALSLPGCMVLVPGVSSGVTCSMYALLTVSRTPKVLSQKEVAYRRSGSLTLAVRRCPGNTGLCNSRLTAHESWCSTQHVDDHDVQQTGLLDNREGHSATMPRMVMQVAADT